MGIYGKYFVATEQDVSRLWRVRKNEAGITPFTKERVTLDALEIDVDAIDQLEGIEEKSLLAEDVACLFGWDTKVELATPQLEGSEQFIYRFPHPAVERLVARSPSGSSLFLEWKEHLSKRARKNSRQDRFDESIAFGLFGLAKQAVESGRSLYGFVW